MNNYNDPAIFDCMAPSLRRFLLPVYRFLWGTLGELLFVLAAAVALTALFSFFFIL